MSKVTRVELIDEAGRQYSRRDVVVVKYSLQDNGRTLKVFVNRDFDPPLADLLDKIGVDTSG